MKFLGLVLAAAVFGGAQADAATYDEVYSEFVYSYNSADLHLDNCARAMEPCDNNGSFVDRGDSGGYGSLFTIVLQYQGLNEAPNETPLANSTITIKAPEYWYLPYSSYDQASIDVTFDENQNITQWRGYAVDRYSYDGYGISSEGYADPSGYTIYDSFRPMIDARFFSTRPGYWQMESRTLWGCYNDDEYVPCGSSFSAPPEPVMVATPIPLPASLPLLTIGLIGLGLWRRRALP